MRYERRGFITHFKEEICQSDRFFIRSARLCVNSALSVVYKIRVNPRDNPAVPRSISDNDITSNNLRQHIKHQLAHSSRMVKVTVAGGSNGLGRVIVRAIAATGKHEVSVLSRQVRDHRHNNLDETIANSLAAIIGQRN
jgi:hypothetical protein